MDGARDVKADSVPGAAGLGGGRLVRAGSLRTGPLAGELTSCLIGRVAGRYGMERGEVLAQWSLAGSPARHPEGGGVRADAEVILNGAGRRVLAELCGVASRVLARALPAYLADGPAENAVARGRWRVAQTVAGPAVFGCLVCRASHRAGGVRAAREVAAGRGRRPDVVAPGPGSGERGGAGAVPVGGVRRRAVRTSRDPDVLFDLAPRWWEQALRWERETMWPRRCTAWRR